MEIESTLSHQAFSTEDGFPFSLNASLAAIRGGSKQAVR